MDILSLAGLWGASTIALWGSLALTRADPLHKPLRSGGLHLAWMAALWGCQALGLGEWTLLLLSATLAVGIWALLLRPAPLYAVAAGLLAGVFLDLLRLLQWTGVHWALLLAAAVCLTALCWQRRWTLLPEDSGTLTAGGRTQALRFTLSLAAVGAVLLLGLTWLCWLLDAFPDFSIRNQRWLAAFTVTAVGAAVLLTRQIAFDAIKRVEALLDKQYQTELLNLMQIIRSQRHDFNFHLQTIFGMIETRRYDECAAYVREMVSATGAMNGILPLRDPAISAMLNSFQAAAAQKGIALRLDISSDLAYLPCTVYEINTVIGNLLQNAIDETAGHRDKWIQAAILKRGGSYVIKVTNPCGRVAEDFKDAFRPGFSTKQSHEGIGLATVRRIVDRCGGSVYPEFKPGCVSFVVHMPMIQTDLETA